MLLDPKTVADLAQPFLPQTYLRMMRVVHRASPLGMGFGNTRFSSPNKTFQLIYIARDLATAIAETIVRDRFECVRDRVLDEPEIGEWVVCEVSATDPLLVLDLRTTGLLRPGVSTDASRAKVHAEGQTLSEEVYSTFDVGGLPYLSRLTASECIAVYDRAVNIKLEASRSTELVCRPDLIPALRSGTPDATRSFRFTGSPEELLH